MGCGLYKMLKRFSKQQTIVLNDVLVKWDDSTLTSTDVETFLPLVRWTAKTSEASSDFKENGVTLEAISILSAFKPGRKVLFIHAHVIATMIHRGERVRLPGIVTFRGPSVAVLLWCIKRDAVQILLVKQPRVAAGCFTWEAPAGMLDAGATLVGAMFDEIKQETGLTIGADRLIEIGNAYSSPGLLDEEYTLYAAHCPEMQQASAGGNEEEQEVISSVEVFALKDAPLHDAKLRCLLQAAESTNVFKTNDAD